MKKWISILLFCGVASTAMAQDTGSLSTADTAWRNDPGFSYMASLDSMLRIANYRVDSLNAHMKVVTNPGHDVSTGFSAFFRNKAVQIFFWSLLAVFIAYIIYALFFRYPAGKALKEENSIEILEDGKLLDEDVYRQRIAVAESEGNYRLATRHHFLLTLAQLNALQKIHFTPEKTNADYIGELKDDHRLDAFVRLSNIFTYVWYGKREINAEDYKRINQFFTEIYKLT